ncbi:hypothetical protein M231_08072, partial [Tremella mesenterica]
MSKPSALRPGLDAYQDTAGLILKVLEKSSREQYEVEIAKAKDDAGWSGHPWSARYAAVQRLMTHVRVGYSTIVDACNALPILSLKFQQQTSALLQVDD